MSLAAIHILKKELALSDREYRELLFDSGGVTSAKFLDADGDRAVMAALYTLRDRKRAAAASRTKSPAERKIWQLWYQLKVMLPFSEQNVKYLYGIVKKATDLSDLSDLSELKPGECYKAIEALKLRIAYEERRKPTDEVPF